MAEPVASSILNTTKKALGLAEDYDYFDSTIIMHINSVFSTLHQLGVGPKNGFMIEDDVPIWGQFIGLSPFINSVKSLMYVRVRLLFDPPATSFAIEALEKQALEFEWRLREATTSTNLSSDVGQIPGAEGVPLWNLTGLTEFPDEALLGDIGVDLNTGNIWRNI